MKKVISLIIVLILIAAVGLTGCTTNNSDTLEQQVQSLQQEKNKLKEENDRLTQQNTDLSQFKERVSVSLYKVEGILYNLKNEGFLPFTGTEVNAPELIGALKGIRNIDIETEGDEMVLSMMPREWSEDFKTILMVYDVYKPAGNMTEDKAGTITTMAGIFKKTNEKWELVKFTREYKGDDSFSIKNL